MRNWSLNVIVVLLIVSVFQFVNPHVQIVIDVKNDQGNVEKWVGEATSPNMLVRDGWNKNTLRPGDQVTLTGHRARKGSNYLLLEKLVLSNGREMSPQAS